MTQAVPLLVTSPAEAWAEWTDKSVRVLGQVATPFDEPDHPCGQWTGRLTWVTEVDGVATIQLEFLVADFDIAPGTKLGFFVGSRHIADLTADPNAPYVLRTFCPVRGFSGSLVAPTSGIEPVYSQTYTRAKSVRNDSPETVFVPPDVACCECGGEVSVDEGGLTGVCLECGAKLTVKADGNG